MNVLRAATAAVGGGLVGTMWIFHIFARVSPSEVTDAVDFFLLILFGGVAIAGVLSFAIWMAIK